MRRWIAPAPGAAIAQTVSRSKRSASSSLASPIVEPALWLVSV
jgi:hypothetical protein